MAGISFLGNSGDKIQNSYQTTTNNTDSFNSTFSRTQAFSDVGNTVFNYGLPASGAAGVATSLGPYLVAGAAIVAGLILLTRKS